MNKMAERTLKKINTDRRRFLEMLSKYGVSTGVLKASSLAGAMMGARFAEAQDSQKKFILIYHPNGSPNGRYLGGQALNPFKPYASSVANLEITISQPGGHGNLWLAAGAQSYNSNDAHSSSVNMQAAKVLGNLTPFRSMQLGVKSLSEAGIDRLNGAAVTRINSPQTALQQYFSGGGSTPPPTGSTGPSLTEKRLSILDANKKGLEALLKPSILSTDERFQLDTHLGVLTDLEARLMRELDSESGGGGGGGGSCASPSLASGASPLQEYKAQGDIAVAALACGLTNVVSIQFNETQASWVPADGTADAVNWTADHHQANHGNGSAMLPAIIEYMNKGVANVIAKLMAAGIYNQTVVLVISEMGDGQDHSAGSGPITVASGMGLRSGQRAAGGNHYAVFADVFRMLGLTPDGRNVYNYGSGGVV